MASPNAIAAALKAIPGAATPTPAPQGGVNIGQMSPLAMQLANEGAYSRAYGPGFLPRIPRTFTEGAFGPFSPILPVGVDQPAEGADMADPRLFQYQVGWNLPVGQPGTEGIKLADFGTLKTLADLYSVARACIELRKNEIAGLEWDIIPTKDAAKSYYGSDRAMRDFGNRRGQALKFFRKPDPDYNSFQTWMSALMEEIFVFDALSLLIRPKRGKGLKRGILGTDLDCVELISGPTMRPLLGMHGEVPRPPNPAYQQYLYGVPRSDYMTMITERDIDEGGLTEAMINQWSTDQFLYLPMVPRRWTPYGFPPIERALIPVMSGLQKQAFQLDYFKEGTIPAVYISPGDVNMTPNQIRELQDALNAFAGDPAWHHKVIVLPPGSKVDPQKPTDVADQFDDIVMTQVCMAFDVNPMELGILPKVAATASPSQIKQMAQGQASVHERLSTKPFLKFLADIFDSILQNVLHQEDMKFTFEGLAEDAEEQVLTQLLVEQVQNGLRSVDEAREQLELQPWGLPMTTEPVFFSAAGPLPFTQPAMPATPGQQQGGQQDARNREVSRRAPTPGPAPLQQSGRAGAVAAPTPGHAAARGALQGARASTGGTPGPSARGSVSGMKSYAAPKAVASELDMLVRHLNKGRRITTWVNRFVPAATMAMISEDLTKGLSPEQCVDIARTLLLPPEEYEWLPKEKARRDAPWEDLSGNFSPKIEAAFRQAVHFIGELIRNWWSGKVVLTRSGLIDQAQLILAMALEPVLRELWAESWRRNDETAGGYFDAWAASHGRDAIEQIMRSRMKNLMAAVSEAIQSGRGPDWIIDQLPSILDAANRAEMIAVTEMGRAGSAASVARYRSQGATHKEWLTANDSRVCAKCKQAQDEGPVPLDTLFSNGMLGPPAHPRCRCTLMPQYTHGVTLKADDGDLHGEEPEVTCERGHRHHGYGGAGVLIRHKGDDGKTRYLLQKRSPSEDDPGTWSLPGGGLLDGETVEQGAFREAQEEMGNLPPSVTVHHHVTDDHGGWAWTTVVCDTPDQFAPTVDGSTADETAGWGWFTRPEIGDLNLHPAFAETWKAVIGARESKTLGKCMMRRVNLSGQVVWESADPCPCQDPQRAAGGGGPEFMPHDAQGIQQGRASGSRGGGTAGHYDDGGVVRPGRPTPEWEDDSVYPQDRSYIPDEKGSPPDGYQGGYWNPGGRSSGTTDTAQPVASGPRGVGKSVVSAQARVYAQLRENFPIEALQWVHQADWSGPEEVPLEQVDFSDMETWSAYHEPDRVSHFESLIEQGEEFNPPVLIKVPGHERCRVVDGHHRALAYRNKDLPLREAWVGVVPFGLVHVAEETHSSQLHQGSSPANG